MLTPGALPAAAPSTSIPCWSPVPTDQDVSDRRWTGQRSQRIGLGTKNGARRKCPPWAIFDRSGRFCQPVDLRKGGAGQHSAPINRNEPICFSPYLYRARNLVERFFDKIKHCRRVATRYDKLAANYLAFVQLASLLCQEPRTSVWPRRLICP